MKTTEGEGVGARYVAHNTSKQPRAGASRWGLERLTRKSITHTDLHKLSDRLVNVQLEHFGAWISHMQTWTHKTHYGPDLGAITTFPLIVYFVLGHGTNTQMSFVPGLPSENLEIPKIETFTTLEAHNFVCRPWIEVTFEAKLQVSSRVFQRYVARHYTQINQADSRLLMIGSQIANLTFDPFFAHNLCFNYPNGSCEIILSI